MKRKRNPKPSRIREGKSLTDEKIEEMGTSSFILDIPEAVLIEIVLRLPVKAIVMCKCVCKPWHRVISDCRFAKMHFARAEPCPLIRTSSRLMVSRMLYLIEPSEINVSYNHKNFSCPETEDGVNLNLDTRLKIPLCNVKMVNQNNASDPKLSFCGSAGKGSSKKRCVRVKPKEQKFQIVNSCNGFLCLSDRVSNNPLVVSNPVTGEYLKLPKTDDSDKSATGLVSCGFGFGKMSNQYKVLRIVRGECKGVPCLMTGKQILSREVAEIHTLGTGSWRPIGHSPNCGYIRFPTYLSGSIYWLHGTWKNQFVYSFDFDKEKFEAIQLPPCTEMLGWDYDTRITVLRDRLSFCTGIDCSDKLLSIWVLEKDRERLTWKKFETIDTDGYWSDYCSWPLGSYLPINFRKDKGLLMFQSPKSAFFYYEPKSGSWKYFRIYDSKFESKAKYKAVAHIPSFMLFKDVVKGDCVEILNISSRCSAFRLPGETKPIFLSEEARVMISEDELTEDEMSE